MYATNRNGYFGPVCDDGWGQNEANVVCRYIHIKETRTYLLLVFEHRIFVFRQLGYSGGRARTGSYYGSVSGDFAMDDVVCSGTESYLQNCEYSTTDNCGTDDGAGVECY